MGTVVTIHVVEHEAHVVTTERLVDRALEWFNEVERVCSRFDPDSELRRLSTRIGEPVAVSDVLFEAVRFALAVAEETGGAFDPTVGLLLEAHGFDKDYRTGSVARSAIAGDELATYRDVDIGADEKTLMLRRPLVLDLGAVAKGLAIDMAARELLNAGVANFAVDAGGDLYLAGLNANGESWSVGIRHPRDEGAMIETRRVSDVAVCTSGDYERRIGDEAGGGHHLIDPRTKTSAGDVASATVLAPSAMVADALATAAFVLGPVDGISLLERQGVDGVIYTSALARHSTAS